MTQPNIKELVQTDVNAIALLLNESLQPQGITAKAVMRGCLLTNHAGISPSSRSKSSSPAD